MTRTLKITNQVPINVTSCCDGYHQVEDTCQRKLCHKYDETCSVNRIFINLKFTRFIGLNNIGSWFYSDSLRKINNFFEMQVRIS